VGGAAGQAGPFRAPPEPYAEGVFGQHAPRHPLGPLVDPVLPGTFHNIAAQLSCVGRKLRPQQTRGK